MADTFFETRDLRPGLDHAAPRTRGSILLFGDEVTAPLWLWLVLENDEIAALEDALLEHLRSPLFPARVGERAVHPGDDIGLLDFACAFAPIASRFAQGRDLVVAATRIVAERGGPLCRQAALACIEALQHRQHAEARNLAEPAAPTRLRHFVLAARLCADLWLRFVPSADSGRSLSARLADVTDLRPVAPFPVSPVAAPMPPDAPGISVLQPFEPPNDRAEWQIYQPLSTPMPLRAVPRDAGRRLGALAEAAPGFARPIAEIRRTLALAAHAGRPSPRLRPILLVGAPGIGKTWFARRLAQALDLPFAGLNLGGATDNRCLQGTARGWSAATPAWPIAEMARLCVPNPLLFLDEVDKAGGQRENNGRAHDTLLAMIEPESAACWFDECLRTAADLRNVLWIMAANETRGIPATLLSRLSVHQIEPPPASAFSTVLAGLLDGIAGDIGCEAADLPALEPETEEALCRSFARHRNLRRLRAMVEECLGVAAEAALSAAN
ncbi:MAG TPA: AAA family ATPase [Acetobacteraceae bacterium]|nr:AAA family ATPase [Acetobacteraceae bacterium]